MPCEIIKLIDIKKSFKGRTVIDGINLSINKGEVCSILGENGAGKSTLMKILAGVYSMDSGKVIFEDSEVELNSPKNSQNLGIRMIFQDPQLIDIFTVQDNIFLGNEVQYEKIPVINEMLQMKRAQEILNYLQCNINVGAYVSELSFAQKKMVEIAKALVFDVKVIILDEVSAAFTELEVQNLFKIIERLKKLGVAVIYLSHKIEEVVAISDKMVVLRDGKVIEEYGDVEGIPTNSLIKKMAGEDYINRYPKTKAKAGREILRIEKIRNTQNSVKDVSLYIKKGEIVGIAGMIGAGKSSLTKLIAGIEKAASGKIIIDGKEVKIKSPSDSIQKGIIYLSDDNDSNIFNLMDIYFNTTLANLDKATRFIGIQTNIITEAANHYIKKLNIKVNDPFQPAKYLSRGTQQKVAISKCLYADARVLVMDEPSMSLDIASKVELYNIMNKLAHNGKSIFIASSDLREIIGMCDRVYVMFDGKIVAELNSAEASSVRILYFALGEK